jgi:hypothetical protein
LPRQPVLRSAQKRSTVASRCTSLEM